MRVVQRKRPAVRALVLSLSRPRPPPTRGGTGVGKRQRFVILCFVILILVITDMLGVVGWNDLLRNPHPCHHLHALLS